MWMRRFIEPGPMQALGLGVIGGLCLVALGIWTISTENGIRGVIGGTGLAISGAIFFGFSVFVIYKRR